MIKTDMIGDMDGRDLMWLTVLGTVLREPTSLGLLVMKLEALVLDELSQSPRSISRCLHEMDRGGHIVLASTAKGWRVSLGPKGRDTFLRLMGEPPAVVATGLEAIGRRLRETFAGVVGSSAA